ncbi:DNA repair and recombination protein [Yarrowia sp. B02]|nr:DNA repair and recombination protein [Yarrowia sp. B02]
MYRRPAKRRVPNPDVLLAPFKPLTQNLPPKTDPKPPISEDSDSECASDDDEQEQLRIKRRKLKLQQEEEERLKAEAEKKRMAELREKNRRISKEEAAQMIRAVAEPTPARKADLGVLKSAEEIEREIQSRERKERVESEKISTRNLSFNALYRKKLGHKKKHKTWDGDGIVVVKGEMLSLYTPEGKGIVRGYKLQPQIVIEVGQVLKVGPLEVELESSVVEAQKGVLGMVEEAESRVSEKPRDVSEPSETPDAEDGLDTPPPVPLAAVETYTLPAPTSLSDVKRLRVKLPAKITEDNFATFIQDVKIDPILNSALRPHQREAVDFLYRCVMGFNPTSGYGALLADEMGMGKTLMSIALIWTLLKQSPLKGEPPLAKRVLIVCPVTLVNNWKTEIKKWLGPSRLGVMAITDSMSIDLGTVIRDFTYGRVNQVMIIGYERLVRISDQLRSANFDLVICDEGHRMKTAGNKAANAIQTLGVARKIILSGTPIQNDLREFFVMVDFLNPGLLSSFQQFNRDYILPIVRSRAPDAFPSELEKGQKQSARLSSITGQFILRRTADILSRFLPPKTETVLFCLPNAQQTEIYTKLSSEYLNRLERHQVDSFKSILSLRKLCNSPILLSEDGPSLDKGRTYLRNSGKMNTLFRMIGQLRARNKMDPDNAEKVVIVSSFTQTLDVIEGLVKDLKLTYTRLDGSVQASTRTKIVKQFNSTSADSCFVFLLSARAGGVGINLIGASRLFLFDPDWNPAVDLQAMARIHRDGQKKPVYIYRLLTTGCIDEKIFQRQTIKTGLASSLIEGTEEADTFSDEDLKKLFSIDEETHCNTHDLMECKCEHNGEELAEVVDEVQITKATATDSFTTARELEKNQDTQTRNLKTLLEYKHISPDVVREQWDSPSEIGDVLLEKIVAEKNDLVSYILTKTSVTTLDEVESESIE